MLASIALSACDVQGVGAGAPVSGLAFSIGMELERSLVSTGGIAATPAARPATPAGPPAPTATPRSGGGSGGGSAQAPAPVEFVWGDRSGRVLAALGGRDGAAIAGARIQAFGPDGEASAETDPDGGFALGAISGPTDLLLSAPGRVSSLVAGWNGERQVFRLASATGAFTAFDSHVPVSGLVVTAEEGAPVAGAVVMGGDGLHTQFGPAVTDAAGRFAATALTRGGSHPVDMAAWAFKPDASGQAVMLGLATGFTVGEGTAFTVEVARAAGHVSLDARHIGDRYEAALTAVAPNGVAVNLKTWRDRDDATAAPFFALAEGSLVLSLVADAPDGRAQAGWRSRVEAESTVRPMLLPYVPNVRVAAPWRDGQPFTWPAVAGASAYRLALGQAGFEQPLWEAATMGAGLTWRGLPAVTPDEWVLTALGGIPTAQIAAVGSARQLRLVGEHEAPWRWSSRRMALE